MVASGPVLQTLLLLVFGLVQLFFGYQLFRWLVMIAGAFTGFFLAPQLLGSTGSLPTEPWVVLLAALLLALLFGALAWFAFRVVVFLWGFGVGYSLLSALSDLVLFAVIAGVVLGVLALLFQRVVIVALTALSGASVTAFAVLSLMGRQPAPNFDPFTAQPWLGLAVLVLAAVGAIVQYRRPAAPSRLRV